MTLSIEKKTFQISIAVAIAVLLFVGSLAFNMGMKVSRLEADIAELTLGQEHIINSYNRETSANEVRITALEYDNTDLKIRLATIETKLTSIEALLIDIKQDIKEHQREVASR